MREQVSLHQYQWGAKNKADKSTVARGHTVQPAANKWDVVKCALTMACHNAGIVNVWADKCTLKRSDGAVMSLIVCSG